MNATAKTCRLCGVEFASRAVTAHYCCDDHRKLAFNTQATRGRHLYNAYMLTRFERDLAKASNIGLSQINRLCSHWHMQDQDHDLVRTWAPITSVKDAVGHLMYGTRGRI